MSISCIEPGLAICVTYDNIHVSRCSGLVHWDDPEGWDGGRGGSGWGTHVQPWLIHVNVWQKPLQYYN